MSIEIDIAAADVRCPWCYYDNDARCWKCDAPADLFHDGENGRHMRLDTLLGWVALQLNKPDGVA